MKRTAYLIGLVFTLCALMGVTACEPKATITAKPEHPFVFYTQNGTVSGTVTPAKATKRVVLQRTFGGVWKDWKQSGSFIVGDPVHPLVANVNQSTGRFTITYLMDSVQTLHLRVRTDGGQVSPGFYVSVA